jgi:hypothetical protein
MLVVDIVNVYTGVKYTSLVQVSSVVRRFLFKQMVG